MSDADLPASPDTMAPKRASGFCFEIKMMFGIDVDAGLGIREIVQKAYASSKDEMLTADEFMSELDE